MSISDTLGLSQSNGGICTFGMCGVRGVLLQLRLGRCCPFEKSRCGVACRDGMLGCSCYVDGWTVLGSAASFLGRPWRRDAVLSVSVSALCGCGTGGALMASLRMVSKCVESGWRPGSMLMEGARVLMYMASLMPVVFG